MRLDEAQWHERDMVQRMALAKKYVRRSLLETVGKLDAIIAYNKTTQAQNALLTAKAEVDRFKAEVDQFATDYADALTEIAAGPSGPMWDQVKAAVAEHAADFTALAAELQARADAVQAVVTGGGTLQQIRDAVQAVYDQG